MTPLAVASFLNQLHTTSDDRRGLCVCTEEGAHQFIEATVTHFGRIQLRYHARGAYGLAFVGHWQLFEPLAAGALPPTVLIGECGAVITIAPNHPEEAAASFAYAKALIAETKALRAEDPYTSQHPLWPRLPVLTREQWLSLVWTYPLDRLANLVGTSARALTQRIDRLRIPQPWAGLWPRVSLGYCAHPHGVPAVAPLAAKTPASQSVATLQPQRA